MNYNPGAIDLTINNNINYKFNDIFLYMRVFPVYLIPLCIIGCDISNNYVLREASDEEKEEEEEK